MRPLVGSVAELEEPQGREQARSVQTTWNYTLASIVFYFVVLDAILLLSTLANYLTPGSPVDAALVLIILVSAAAHVRCCWFLRAGRGGGVPHPGWMIALFTPAAAAWVLGLFNPEAGLFAALPLWMAVNVIAPLMPRARRWGVLLAGAVLTISHPMLAAGVFGHPFDLADASRAWLLLVYCVMLPVMVLASLWWWEIVVTLDRNRSLAAELAVAEERLRFASDLHDIQGHHLQVIALKSELAERMLAIDPAAARDHLHEMRLIAKQALEETRSLVAGYREVALNDELENAREVLLAAGAQCELGVGSMPTDDETRRVLALVVREATTNILRHSDATHVWIRLDTTDEGSALEIGNDAVSRADASGRATSSGLDGLRDRVAALDGRLDAEFDESGNRFDPRVWVPARVGVDA